ncbi:hypothetical protein ACTXT7_014364 [Hymenolepis weldensis]
MRWVKEMPEFSLYNRTPSAGPSILRTQNRPKPKAQQRRTRSKSPNWCSKQHVLKLSFELEPPHRSNSQRKYYGHGYGNFSNNSYSDDEQIHLGNGEIFANRAFMKNYYLHHKFESGGKNKTTPLFKVRSFTDIRPVSVKKPSPAAVL